MKKNFFSSFKEASSWARELGLRLGVTSQVGRANEGWYVEFDDADFEADAATFREENAHENEQHLILEEAHSFSEDMHRSEDEGWFYSDDNAWYDET